MMAAASKPSEMHVLAYMCQRSTEVSNCYMLACNS